MTDRLAEIEGIRDALHDIPDDISVPVSAGLARDLLAVAKAARDAEESLSNLADSPHHPNGDGTCATCHGLKARNRLRAALANLDGGAS